MAEPWTALGVVILKDLVFKEVLLKLGKEALEDYVKDFFKDCIKQGVQSAKADVLKKALGEALQQFLRIVQAPIPHPQLSHALFGVGEGGSIPQVLSKNTQD